MNDVHDKVNSQKTCIRQRTQQLHINDEISLITHDSRPSVRTSPLFDTSPINRTEHDNDNDNDNGDGDGDEKCGRGQTRNQLKDTAQRASQQQQSKPLRAPATNKNCVERKRGGGRVLESSSPFFHIRLIASFYKPPVNRWEWVVFLHHPFTEIFPVAAVAAVATVAVVCCCCGYAALPLCCYYGYYYCYL
uniref:Uncharacterized protein n=1 Tax=Setaria digitata TaxID=48799 RepID=A0A915PPU5_9BILA